MKSIRRKMLLGLAMGFAVVVVMLIVADAQSVGQHLRSFEWSYLPIILGATIINYILRFFKWQYYLRLIGVRDLPRTESARIFLAGFPLAVTPGKVGEAMKGVWLNRSSDVATAKGVTVVFAERVSDGLALLILCFLGIFTYPQYWPIFALVSGALAASILIFQFRPLTGWFLNRLDRLPLIGRGAIHLREFDEGAYRLFRPVSVLIALSLGTVAWFGEGVAFYYVLLGLGVPGGSTTLSLAVFILSFSTIVGAVSALPGGLGATEITITGMLTLLMGLQADTAAAATLIIRFATLWFGVGIGLVVWIFSRDLLMLDPQNETDLQTA